MWLNPTKYWIRCLLDTGATVHAVGRRSVLKNFDSSIKIRVRGFDGSMRVSLGAGTLELEVPSTDGTGTVVVLKRVLLLPNLGDQVIISPGKLENEGVLFEFCNPMKHPKGRSSVMELPSGVSVPPEYLALTAPRRRRRRRRSDSYWGSVVAQ